MPVLCWYLHLLSHIFCLILTQREMYYHCYHFGKVRLRQIELIKGTQLGKGKTGIQA